MSSYYDDASLMLLASGGAQKDGKVYSIKPTDGTGDFTFTRGSNLSATRVNASQLIEKGRENLLQQSNTFTTTWGSNNVTLTGGQSGYDGTSDAWLLTATGSTARLELSVSTNLNVFSIYAKAGTTDGIALRIIGGTNPYIYWNLNDGSFVGTSGGGGINPSNQQVTNVGGGWYRIQITTALVITAMIYVSDSAGNLVTSGNIYIQDAQLEQGLAATDYIETTTTSVSAGILENTPRFDYSGGATCPSLLLEPSRTNLIEQSEYKDGSGVTNGVVTQAAINSPEGVKNTYKLNDNSAGGTNQVNQTISVTLPSAGTYTYSVFCKADQLNWVRLRTLGFDAGGNLQSWFNLSDGTKGTINHDDATIEPYIDGWYRCSVTFSSTTDLSGFVYVYLAESDNTTSVSLDGTSSIFMYGFQCESGSYATSYIPTYSVSQTRAADSCVKTGISSLIGQTEGTIFAEFDSPQFLSGSYIGISDGTTSNRQIFGFEGASGNSAALRLYGFWTFIYGTFASGEKIKVALAYKNNDFALYVNGTQAGTNSGATISGTLSQFVFNSGASAQNYQGNVYQTALFKTRLSNLDLAILTGATTYNTFAAMALALNYTVYE
jgi:hypothetical protein